MNDDARIICEIKIWKFKIATLWHVDPMKNDNLNSCGWFGPPIGHANWNIRIHPRWHFWHWKLQVYPFFVLKRWLFSRCSICKKRFSFKDSIERVIGLCKLEEAKSPGWFRNTEKIAHFGCFQNTGNKEKLIVKATVDDSNNDK